VIERPSAMAHLSRIITSLVRVVLAAAAAILVTIGSLPSFAPTEMLSADVTGAVAYGLATFCALFALMLQPT
jgi:hypothetical protein